MPWTEITRLQFTEKVRYAIKDRSGADVFAAADRMGFWRVLSRSGQRAAKRAGASRNWLKTKCFAESELILIGTEIGKDGKPVALLAQLAEGELAFAGGALIALRGRAGSALERDSAA